MVSWLLDWTRHSGLDAVVLTRGYRGHPPNLPFHVLPDSPADQSGDEPLMLARAHDHARVIVDPKRIRSGPWAEKKFSPDLFILDDGFQHLAAKRDMDLVLLSEHDLCTGWNRVLPRGTWREGKQALARADAFVVNVTGSSLDRLFPAALDRLQPFDRPVFFARLVPCGLVQVRTRATFNHLDKAPYLLFTGIANPERVQDTITTLLGYPPVDVCFFPDHHAYSHQDRSRIKERASAAGAAHLVCTSKDAIKLDDWEYPLLFEIQTRLSFFARAKTSLWFADWLAQKIRTL
jgi:tetraacyldisaccharide 4'-kinase